VARIRQPVLRYIWNDYITSWSHHKIYSKLSNRLETRLYRFNTSSDGRMVVFLKTDRDSEAIVRYCTCYSGYDLRISLWIYPSYQRGWVETSFRITEIFEASSVSNMPTDKLLYDDRHWQEILEKYIRKISLEQKLHLIFTLVMFLQISVGQLL